MLSIFKEFFSFGPMFEDLSDLTHSRIGLTMKSLPTNQQI